MNINSIVETRKNIENNVEGSKEEIRIYFA